MKMIESTFIQTVRRESTSTAQLSSAYECVTHWLNLHGNSPLQAYSTVRSQHVVCESLCLPTKPLLNSKTIE